jgi:hypothetical protein
VVEEIDGPAEDPAPGDEVEGPEKAPWRAAVSGPAGTLAGRHADVSDVGKPLSGLDSPPSGPPQPFDTGASPSPVSMPLFPGVRFFFSFTTWKRPG